MFGRPLNPKIALASEDEINAERKSGNEAARLAATPIVLPSAEDVVFRDSKHRNVAIPALHIVDAMTHIARLNNVNNVFGSVLREELTLRLICAL